MVSPSATIYVTQSESAAQPRSRGGLELLRAVLNEPESLPAIQEALNEIKASRRRCRPGFPPHLMWCAFAMRYLLSERYVVQFIERLRTAPGLREICGFEQIPSASTFSRFFGLLTGHRELLESALPQIVKRLREHLPDLGEAVAVDSTDIQAYSNGNHEIPIDPNATWGRRTTKARSGVKSETEAYFGYKLHMLADSVHGAPLVYKLTPAHRNDSPLLPDLVDKAQSLYGWFKPRVLTADRGYDSQDNHLFLIGHRITPVIHIRKPTSAEGLYDGLYAKNGVPVCGNENVPMQYVGTDRRTGHHLFRCNPEGCEMKAHSTSSLLFCNTTYWQDPMSNPRVLGIVSRASSEWKRLYSRRQSVERLFGSLKQSRLLNRHQYLGRAKVETHAIMSMLTYAATTLVRAKSGDLNRLRHMRLGVE